MAGHKLDNLIAPQFAFRKNYQAHEAIWILRTLCEKANEWQRHLYVLDGDLYKAYDLVRHAVVVKGLRRKRVPDVLVAAWLREIRRSRSVFKLDRQVRSDPIARTRSLLQGDPSAPS
eukprot:7802722-Karenia_brevis.AAC.1